MDYLDSDLAGFRFDFDLAFDLIWILAGFGLILAGFGLILARFWLDFGLDLVHHSSHSSRSPLGRS